MNELFGLLSEKLERRRVRGQIYVVGGAAIALGFLRDRTTRDVDAKIESAHSEVLSAVAEIAREQNLPETWLNEQATAFMPREPDQRARTVFGSASLTVTGASAEHLLAMKMESGRDSDLDDIETLIRELRIGSPDRADRIRSALFPESPPKQAVTDRIERILAGPESSGSDPD